MFEFLKFGKREEKEAIIVEDGLLKPEMSLEEMKSIADQLEKLQSSENEGRGVSCVRTAIFYLRGGDLDGAKAVCKNDHDKIQNYPDIEKFLEKYGLAFKFD
ncbi:MAG: hypothetical protein WAV11_02250 [Minisyncoccia bacterium]